MHREDDDGDPRVKRLQVFEKLDAIHAGHRDVGDDRVGLERLDPGERFRRVAGFAADLHVGFLRDDGLQALAHDPVVFEEINPFLRFRFFLCHGNNLFWETNRR